MNRMLAAAAVLVATSVAVLPLLAGPAFAADAPVVSWSVSPASPVKSAPGRVAFSYSTKPGVEITDYVDISNHGTQPTTFNVYATDATNDSQTGGFSLLPANKKPTDLGSWITLPINKVTVAPGEAAQIPIQVLVPSDAAPGDHSAGIIASIYRASTAAHGQRIRVEERVAARMYLHIAGPVSAGVTASGLTSSYTSPIVPFATGTNTVNYSVKNTGNLRVDVLQRLTITGPFGIVLGSAKGPRLLNILPGQAVQQKLTSIGIAPLFLISSRVTLTTAAPTDTVVAATTYTDAGTVAAPITAPKYASFSSDTQTAGIPWTVIVIILILALAIWLLVRYVRASRDRVYLAIDAAANEAREKALAEAKRTSKVTEREKEPVA
jgi:hypothetical protein